MKPPYYDNNNNIDSLSLRKIFDAIPAIDEKNRDLLTAMVLTGPTSDGELESLSKLTGSLKIGIHAIRTRLKSLVLLGVIEETQRPSNSNRRPAALFRPAVPTLNKLMALPVEKSTLPALPKDHEVQVMSENIAKALSGPDGSYFIDNLFCTILFTALPHSRRLVKEPTHVVVSWFRYTVQIVLRPFHGGAICKGDDVRFYVGLITYLTELVRRDGIPTSVLENGSWTVPLSEVLKCLGMNSEGGNQDTAIVAFERLAGTRFELTSLPAEIMERYAFLEAKQYFQPLSNFGVYEQLIKKYKRRLITFTLPPNIQSALLAHGDSFFRLSPNALHYAEPYFLRIHLWAKRRLGSKLSHVEVTQQRAWKEINPGTKFVTHHKLLVDTIINFAAFYHELLTQRQITSAQYKKLVMASPVLEEGDSETKLLRGRVNLFGYILRYTQTHLYIDRDPTDPISGIQIRKPRGTLSGNVPEQGELLPTPEE